MKKRIIASVLALSMLFGVSGKLPNGIFYDQTVNAATVSYVGTYDNLTYWTFDDHIAIKSCDKTVTGKIVVPDTIDNLPVTELIEYAFKECTSLESIVLPKTVKKIGYDAFYRCHALKSIDVSESVESIGVYAFYGCVSLEAINVDSNNKNYKSVDGVLFDKSMKTLIQYPNKKANTNYTVPNGVYEVEEYAFANSMNLVTLILPDTVTNINKFTFCNSPKLQSVTLSKNITAIGESAFDSCSSLTSVNIPAGITDIGEFAFLKCKALTEVVIPNGVTILEHSAFSQCSNLKNVKLPANLIEIRKQAFGACSLLESIDFPNTLQTIGEDAFYLCTSLKSVILPESVSSLGSSAFSSCSSLQSFKIRNKSCEIFDSKFTICNSSTIYGYGNSTAQKYAETYGRKFVKIDEQSTADYSDTFSSLDEMRENLIALQWYVVNRPYHGKGIVKDFNSDDSINVIDLCIAKRAFMSAINSIYHILDSDDNGYPDCLEYDDRTTDSDGDGLSDYDEFMYTATNPLLADTDENGISDDMEDLDNDGLSNIEEIKLETNPLSDDSDMDGLKDGEEIELGTDPNNPDSDNDGAFDGWEVENGYNPLKYNSSFSISTSATSNTVTASVKINGSGDIANTLEIEPVEDNILLESSIPGYIDSAFNFSAEADFSSATISFDFDSSLLLNSDFTPTIYYFNEETQLLEELETTINGNKASATVSHFSTYILLDKSEYDKIWNVEIKAPNQQNLSTGMSVIFVLDRSSSMNENDAENLRNTLTNEYISKTSFEKNLCSIIAFTKYADLISNLSNDSVLLQNAVDSIENDDGYGSRSGTDCSQGVNLAIQELKKDKTANKRYIILISDGEDTTTAYNYDSLIKEAIENDISIYTIGLAKADNNLLYKLANETEGKYTFSSNSNEFIENFTKAQSETADYHTDSNGDGISDYYTKLISDGELRYGTGGAVTEDFTYEDLQESDDWDGDGVKNGEEITITATAGKTTAYYSSAPTYFNNGAYRFYHPKSHLYLDIKDESVENGAELQVWEKAEGNQNQIFNVSRLKNGNYILSPNNSEKIIEVRDSSKSNGAKIAQWDNCNIPCQQWKIVANADGTVSFQNANSKKYLGVKSLSAKNGTPVIQYSDSISGETKFKFEKMTADDIIGATWKANPSTFIYQKAPGIEPLVDTKYAYRKGSFIMIPVMNKQKASLFDVTYIDPYTVDMVAWKRLWDEIGEYGNYSGMDLAKDEGIIQTKELLKKLVTEGLFKELVEAGINVVIPLDTLEALFKIGKYDNEANYMKTQELCDRLGCGLKIKRYIYSEYNDAIWGAVAGRPGGYGPIRRIVDSYRYEYEPCGWYENESLDQKIFSESSAKGTWKYTYK